MTAPAPAGLWSPIHRTLLPHGIGPDGVRELYVRGGGEILSRSSLAVPAGTTADFGSYFGGFPAGVWAAHTTVERVRTRARVTGTAEVSLCRTDGRGGREVIAFERATDGDVVFDTLLAGASGWWWLEVAADPGTDAVVDGIVWAAEGTGPEPGRIAVSITTFDREADCIRLIERLDSDPVVAGLIGRITVADQGSRRLAAAEGFAEVAERVGDRLVVIEQANLGGAGGYSRGMLEAEAGDWEHALLIDDDVDLEPESVLRMAAFAAHARGRRIVGAHMLDLLHPTSVHSWGEVIDRGRFWWGPEDAGLAPVDAAAHRPSTTPAMGRVLDVDFNGWWMCLIPVSVIREIGVALPLFIKWDDAEYGLRAAAIGVPTVSLPGAALWHMPWTGKDNGLDWQVYYQVRNRIVAALLHDGSAVGVVKALFAADVNHLLSLQYGSVEARLLALRDAMSGPEHLPATISRRRADVVQILRRHGQMLHPAAQPTRPADKSSPGFRALPRVLLHQLSPSHRGRTITPTVVPTVDGRWWRLGTLDAASLYAASGDGFFPLRRDRRRFIRYSLLSAVAHARLLMTWHRLAREYRASAQDLASPATWRSIFGE